MHYRSALGGVAQVIRGKEKVVEVKLFVVKKTEVVNDFLGCLAVSVL